LSVSRVSQSLTVDDDHPSAHSLTHPTTPHPPLHANRSPRSLRRTRRRPAMSPTHTAPSPPCIKCATLLLLPLVNTALKPTSNPCLRGFDSDTRHRLARRKRTPSRRPHLSPFSPPTHHQPSTSTPSPSCQVPPASPSTFLQTRLSSLLRLKLRHSPRRHPRTPNLPHHAHLPPVAPIHDPCAANAAGPASSQSVKDYTIDI
ncbi:hypothetical protein R3P38DRAFT_3450392, partial [Favolaschia claudopus]